MTVWEPCPLNKSTNKNANFHISREGTQPKSVPHFSCLTSFLSTKLHMLSVSYGLTCTHIHKHTLSLSVFLFHPLCWQTGHQMRETDLLAWASFSFFVNYHPLTDLTLIHFLSLTLKHGHTLIHVAKTKSRLLKFFIYWYVLPRVNGGT